MLAPRMSETPRRKVPLRILRTTVLLLALLSVGLPLFVMLFENRFLYHPTRPPDGRWDTSKLGFPVEECSFTTEDGVRLHAWYVRERDAPATLLWFHGNAGNLSSRAELMDRLRRLPADVFLIDYRGYGKSEGSPSEEGLYRDARAAYRFLVEERKIPPNRIVLGGKSLGGAIAAELATRVDCASLLLQSTFTSLADMSRRVIPFLPAHWFLRQRYETISKMVRIRVPKLILHARTDEIIPYEMGRRLFDAAPEPKRFVELGDLGHNDWMHVGPAYDEALRAFLRDCLPRMP